MIKRISAFLLNIGLIWFSCFTLAQAQEAADSLSLKASTGVLLSTEEFNPFYLVHNRWGTVTNKQDAFIQVDGNYRTRINNYWSANFGVGLRNSDVYKAYGSVSFRRFSLWAGINPRIIGGIQNNRLTTGSLSNGYNALPLPTIGFEIRDFINLPLTFGYLKFRGFVSHGWFEEDRYISQPLLHQKQFEVVLDLEKHIGLKIYSSLIHSAQYGGTDPLGEKQPSSLKDFKKVFLGSGIPNPHGGTGGEANGLGNHLGITEWTIDKNLGDWRLSLNYQKPFEDLGSIQYISFKDFLAGVRLMLPPKFLVSEIYFELVRSMSQSGPGLPDATDEVQTIEDNHGYKFGGRDDYFNNWLYQSGWTHKGRIISNPLFLTYAWSGQFLGVFPNYENEIINNRLKAYHFGAILEPDKTLSLRVMLTATENFGTYAGLYEGRFAWNGIIENNDFEYVFLGGKWQFYSLIEASKETKLLGKPVFINGLLAVDRGELYNNLGIELGVTFVLKSY
ncbi:capsule assembly Wzi family protein [uncultured Roseivirga sp.]|uniref:capsule assembly Wzi family protein n=1 Tax=uncultured Roseivirga sp. TaxID=543088 RepID=UPI002584DDD2|nr:capsule assembly Wzi family protein [uncultured Roseivirga sp.]